MSVTGSEIQADFCALLRSGAVASLISGKVYGEGERPRDSKAEDAVVTFVTGIDGDVHTGVVLVRIYVPDKFLSNGVSLRDKARCEAIEKAASEWEASLNPGEAGYLIRTAQTIYTDAEPTIQQHFITVRLSYKLVTTKN
jgi:hypothetical protein